MNSFLLYLSYRPVPCWFYVTSFFGTSAKRYYSDWRNCFKIMNFTWGRRAAALPVVAVAQNGAEHLKSEEQLVQWTKLF